ncbi:acetyl-CoA hydrolase/transferase C-terminal domain-containing protein [soil metagenome]
MAPTKLTAEEAAGRLLPTDTLGIPLGPGQPGGFLHALGERDDWVDLTIGGALLVDLYQVFLHAGVHHTSGFFGPAERFLLASGADIQFVPADFRRFAPVLERTRPRVMATAATPPDADGWCSLSLHAGATVGELERAAADPDRVLVVEANRRLPRTVWTDGYRHAIHVDQADILVESDRDLFVLEDAVPGEVAEDIAGLVAPFVPDGATLQTGIGSIPSGVVGRLAGGDGGEYGIHSEMFTTGLMDLHRAGKVTNTRKGTYDGVSITTFAAGTAELYSWLDGNEDVRFLPVDRVNSPEAIARNRNMISVNGALLIDLYGQVVADTLDGHQFSGIGGHEDFVASSGLQLEDRSLICLPSQATREGTAVSRIVAHLPAGTVVTTPRHQLDVVVTEHGVAELRGATVRERAFALAAIAHPSVRDDLLGAADAFR